MRESRIVNRYGLRSPHQRLVVGHLGFHFFSKGNYVGSFHKKERMYYLSVLWNYTATTLKWTKLFLGENPSVRDIRDRIWANQIKQMYHMKPAFKDEVMFAARAIIYKDKKTGKFKDTPASDQCWVAHKIRTEVAKTNA